MKVCSLTFDESLPAKILRVESLVFNIQTAKSVVFAKINLFLSIEFSVIITYKDFSQGVIKIDIYFTMIKKEK